MPGMSRLLSFEYLNFGEQGARSGIERVGGARYRAGELAAGKVGDGERGFLADAHGTRRRLGARLR